MPSLANQAAQITGNIAGQAFGAAFDPFGAKQTAADTAKDEKQRKIERHEQETDLREQQLRIATVKAKLAEDQKEAAKQQQRLQMSNFNPKDVEDVYNEAGLFEHDFKFDEQYFNDTGQFRFLTGAYRRNVHGERDLGGDGKPIFKSDGSKGITFANKEEMQDAVMGSLFDPKHRLAQKLNAEELDLFTKKTAVTEESKSRLQKEKSELDIEESKIRGAMQKEIAQIHSNARGKMDKKLTPSQSDSRAKDFRKNLREEYARVLYIDVDEVPNWQLDDVKNIQKFHEWSGFDEAMKRLSGAGQTAARNKALQQIKKKFNVPDSYIKFITENFLNKQE